MSHIINILILLILTGLVIGLAYAQLCLAAPAPYGLLWFPLILIFAWWLDKLSDFYL